MVAPNDVGDTWTDEVLGLIRANWKPDQVFSLSDVYSRSTELAVKHPGNATTQNTIRRVLQQLRDSGVINFLDNEGHYCIAGSPTLPGDPIGTIDDPIIKAQLIRIREAFDQVLPSSEIQKLVLGFRGRKGIYKPAGASHALWVRETQNSSYQDKDPDVWPDGSWTFRYSPEERNGRIDLKLDTNQSLLNCQRDHTPIGVFRPAPPLGGRIAYKVLGIAFVESFDGTHFILRGEPSNETESPIVETVSTTFDPIEHVPAPTSDVTRVLRDRKFATALREAYRGRCSLCNIGFRIGSTPVAIEAAHIVPVEAGGVRGNIKNGILLCPNHHTLFDQYAWTMDEDFRVMVAPDRALRESAKDNHILTIAGDRLPNLPSLPRNYPAKESINWRREHFEDRWRQTSAILPG